MYRAEFFSYKMEYKDFALFDDDTELSLDYIAWDASQIKIPGKRLAVIKGDLVHITRDGKTAFDGYVNNVSYPAKNVTQVDVLPLLCMMRFEETWGAGYYIPDIANRLWTLGYIRMFLGDDNFTTEVAADRYDELLKIPSEFGPIPSDAERPFGLTDKLESYTFLSMVTFALKTYRVVAGLNMVMQTLQKVHYDVSINTDTITLESDLDNVIERSITLGNSYGSVNKVIVFKPTGTSTFGTAYYLHKDGTVDTDGNDINNRIVPVVSTMEIVDDGDDWAVQALQKAKDIMLPEAYDNEIELTYKSDDALVNPSEIKIGTLATIYAEGVAYQSILTGKVLQNNLIKLIFGRVRVDLTKQLLIDRRANK